MRLTHEGRTDMKHESPPALRSASRKSIRTSTITMPHATTTAIQTQAHWPGPQSSTDLIMPSPSLRTAVDLTLAGRDEGRFTIWSRFCQGPRCGMPQSLEPHAFGTPTHWPRPRPVALTGGAHND